jgi:Domain of unknown function (DUF4432)
MMLASGDLAIDVLPAYGLDLGRASFRGERFSWESASEPWWGGLMFTCGLQNVGVPSEGQPQHGLYRTLPAQDAAVHGGTAQGRVTEGPLELTREIAIDEGGIVVTDVVVNTNDAAEPAPLLYHVNLLWGEVDIDGERVEPRDEDSRRGDWRSLGPPGQERVYEHVGATRAIVRLGELRVTITSNLPRLWQWINPGYGVLGIEPANCSVLGRAHDRAEGRLPMLEPGEARTTTLRIAVE